MSLLDPDLLNSRNPRLFAILSGARPAARISTGIYSVATFNFNLLLSSDWDDFPNDLPGGLEGYGVVDSVEQFIDRFWGALSDDPHGYCVAFTRVRKSEQPAEGGGAGASGARTLARARRNVTTFTMSRTSAKSFASTCSATRVGVYGWHEEP
jgi:hypothetical protein